ncbi:MAG: phosphoenolpyruvate synthase [Candidatus Wildermuthbacteria bacterium]|nr:phosphoenolpyruvate synthase [Candidatus Wildermuthbacteria bacterium]
MRGAPMYIAWLGDVSQKDVALVGGKAAGLGELARAGVLVPEGFVVTTSAYGAFVKESGIDKELEKIFAGADGRGEQVLRKSSRLARECILNAPFPAVLEQEILQAYEKLSAKHKGRARVAVRSSGVHEDSAEASFAGQHDTFLNVSGARAVLLAVRACFASLYSERAVFYAKERGIVFLHSALAVCVQAMVRSDIAASGVAFTAEPETGCKTALVITGSYGLGETIVQGKVEPDEFVVFRPSLLLGYSAIISRTLGRKSKKSTRASKGVREQEVLQKDAERFCLSDREVLHLACSCVAIEERFSGLAGHSVVLDIEWAKDGIDGKIYIVQARQETVHSQGASVRGYAIYKRQGTGNILAQGVAVGRGMAVGRARVVRNKKDILAIQKGDILVAERTDPDWEPVLKRVAGVVAETGGRTSHAAIVARELGIPTIVGARGAMRVLAGKEITLDCSEGVGIVYEGRVPFTVAVQNAPGIVQTKTKVMVNIGSPASAFQHSFLPVQGVGLGRLEFLIASHIKIHPNALLRYGELKNLAKTNAKIRRIAKDIDGLTAGYSNKSRFYLDKLSEGMGTIAAAFWPREVIIRFSDFKTNEYRSLIGGELYEPFEENPMLGWRGASRYGDPRFAEAFGLECKAMLKARNEWRLTNIIPMVPFCRTVEEGKRTIEMMKKHGLSREQDKTLKVYVMCEIPSNVLLADEFLDVFDGMSIGSNDLTQLVLGRDRDSGEKEPDEENNEAVRRMVRMAIRACKKRGKYVGICGQAPSDSPAFLKFLIQEGIDSVSLNPDSVISALSRIARHAG